MTKKSTKGTLALSESKAKNLPEKQGTVQGHRDGFGFVITDWKTNQPKNFEVHHYTDKLFSPFNNYHNNALGHYYLQLPLYGRLLRKMLEGTKYSDKVYGKALDDMLKDKTR